MGDDNDKRRRGGRRNPWGSPVHEGPWARAPGGNGGPPDLEDLLAAARAQWNGAEGGPPASILLIALAVAVLLWLASGLYMVSPSQNAVIQRFGALARVQTEQGLGYHLPWPIESARVLDVSTRNLRIGYIEDPGGRLRAVPEESLILTSDRNLVDIFLTVQWSIKAVDDYLFKIADPQDTLKKVAESALREVVGQTRMDPLVDSQDAVAQTIGDVIQQNLDDYAAGISVNGVQFTKTEIHAEAQEAFQDVQSAKQDAESAQNQAQAYSNKIVPEARGRAAQVEQAAQAYRQAKVAEAKGGAARFAALYTAYKEGREVTRDRLYMEMMEAVLGRADVVVLDGSAGRGAVPYITLDKAQGGQGR
ncbi:MAG TPA: FtsH protease activity modulator HflK [Rhodospirillaceae bacterium]|jgi:membrane protease subunit HflK|nr:FtsH protease activity modulator HflK [Alphaproteobacteria bacterium]HBH26323.1 FtsH protease activity modulator HflK [Rhodospirillaceae bacterium]